jgi:hypothetical protein
MIKQSGTKDHKSRKNPHAAEMFAAARHAKNSERPKQVWTGTGWAR